MRVLSKHGAREDGFTLVELLVVIVILGILVAIAVPTFLGQNAKAQDADAQAQLSTAYANAKADAVDNNGNFPDAATIASDLAKDEPELGAVTTVASPDAITTQGQLYVTTGGTPGGNSDFQAAILSKSGHTCTVTVTGNRAPDFECAGASGGTASVPRDPWDVPVVSPLRQASDPFAVGSSGWQTLPGYASGGDTTNGWGYSRGSNAGIIWPTSSASDSTHGVAATATVTHEQCSTGETARREFQIWLNIPALNMPTYQGSGYYAEFDCNGAGKWTAQIFKETAGVTPPALVKSGAFNLVASDRVVFSYFNGTLTAWSDDGTGFTQLATTQDSTFPQGYAALVASDGPSISQPLYLSLADFGFGTYTP